MPTKIRFCENNKGKGTVIRKLEAEFPDLNIKVKSCIKQCASCRDMVVATIDKKKIVGKNGEELYQNILEELHKV